VLIDCTSIRPNDTDFFPAKARILYRHAEELIFILLLVCRECILMEKNQIRVSEATLYEIG